MRAIAQTTSHDGRCRLVPFLSVALVAVTFGAYSHVSAFEFTNFDDPDYVARNDIVRQGLTAEGLKWAFTTGFMGNWHPLTWLSHMLDCEWFGLNPGAHHATSLVIHCLNAVLLLWVLLRYTGNLERSAAVAGFFALHPLHVESVAWVAERKDLLSTFFWLLTMWSYLRFAERRSILRYLQIVLWFALGLMSKPMVVTLPFVLLLLNYWPLQRSRAFADWRRIILELTPLFVLTTGSCIITFIVQQQGGAVGTIEKFPITTRIGAAAVAYVAYLGKTLLPDNLAVFYPHPGMWPVWQVCGAALLLAMVTAIALALVRTAPYLMVGWFWFLGTLVPVIGLVQVGEQAYADRYTYVPLIGLFIALIWGIGDLALRLRWPVILIRGVGVVGLLVCAMLTMAQVRHWRDTETLFRHAVEVTQGNHVAHYNLGQALSVAGRIHEAVEHYEATLAVKPDHDGALNNLGLTHAIQGHWIVATNYYTQALRAAPTNAEVHFNMGIALSRLGDNTNALAHLRGVLQFNPQHGLAGQYINKLLTNVQQ